LTLTIRLLLFFETGLGEL